MTKLNEGLQPPSVLIFDWHGTLVDTHDAMFSAMEEMLPQLEELGLVEQLLPEDQCRTEDDARLVRYIRIFRRLHPRILAERRVSRTDIFNAIFGDNKAAKLQAHRPTTTPIESILARLSRSSPVPTSTCRPSRPWASSWRCPPTVTGSSWTKSWIWWTKAVGATCLMPPCVPTMSPNTSRTRK